FAAIVVWLADSGGSFKKADAAERSFFRTSVLSGKCDVKTHYRGWAGYAPLRRHARCQRNLSLNRASSLPPPGTQTQPGRELGRHVAAQALGVGCAAGPAAAAGGGRPGERRPVWPR